MARLSTCPNVEQWRRFLQGILTEEEADSLAHHLASCAACLQSVRDLPIPHDTLTEVLRNQSTPPDSALPDAVQRLISRLKDVRASGEHTASHLTAGEELSSSAQTAAPAVVAEQVYDFLAPPQAQGELGRLGPYRIVRVLGSGGMGVVFQARDADLDRFVALKAMKPALAASDTARKRFLREAKLTASLEHDHIVHIYQVGEDRSIPYLAMQMLKGETLDARLRRERTLPVEETLRIAREIAEGLAAAHERGLIHRDIKPSNIWLEATRGRVKILDFGLARPEADESYLTQTGAVAGTPEYMAPEQAQGEKVDYRCDLFSLGCVLYRCCVGEVPFKGHNTMTMLLALAQERTKPPHERNPRTPEALSELVMRLLAKTAADRPASARAVVDAVTEIERELREAPQGRAGGVSPLLSPQPASDINPLLPPQTTGGSRPPLAWVAAALFFVTTLLLAATVTLRTKDGGTLTVTTSEPDAKVFVDGEEKIVIDSKRAGTIELRPGKHQVVVKRGDEEIHTESFTLKSGGHQILHVEIKPPPKMEPLPIPGPLDKLNAARIPIEERFDFQPAELLAVLGTHQQRHFGLVRKHGLALSPNGKRIALAGEDGRISLFDAATLRRVYFLETNQPHLHCITFSPDSKTLVCGTNAGMRAWDVSGDVPHERPGNNVRCAAMVYRPGEAQTLATGHFDGTIRFWDVTNDGLVELPTRYKADSGQIFSLAFSGDGQVLAAIGRNEQVVRRWELGGGRGERARIVLKVNDKTYNAVALSPDGKTLAVASSPTTLRLWDLTGPEPKEHVLKGEPLSIGGVYSVAFAPDGRTVAVGCWAGLSLWDLTAEPKRSYWHPGETFQHLTFTSEPGGLLTVSGDGCLRLWDVRGGEPKETRPLSGHRGYVTAVVYDDKEQALITGALDRTLRYWDVSGGQPVQRETLSPSVYGRIGFFLPTGGKSLVLAPGPEAHQARLWDLTGRKVKERGAAFPWWLNGSFSSDGNTLAFSATEKLVRVVDLRDDRLTGHSLDQHPKKVEYLALSPNGRLLACEQEDKVWLWNLASRTAQQVLNAKVGQVQRLEFSPDSRTLVLGGTLRQLHVWDVSGERATEVFTLPSSTYWQSFAFSPDSTLFVACGTEGVFLWDATSWRLRKHWPIVGVVRHVAFVGDSQYLAWGNYNGTTYVLRLHPGSAGALPSQAGSAGASPSPASVAREGETPAEPVRRSPLDKLDAAKFPAEERFPWFPKELIGVAGSHNARHFSDVYAIAWSPDGKSIACGGVNGTISLFDAATMRRRILGESDRGNCAGLTFRPEDGALVASHGYALRTWELRGAEPKAGPDLRGTGFTFTAVAHAPNGKMLAVGLSDGRVRFYDTSDPKLKEIATVEGHGSAVASLSFAGDGKMLASLGMTDESICLFDLSRPVPEKKHGFKIRDKAATTYYAVALSPDGKTLALGAHNPASLRLWDLSGEQPAERKIDAPADLTGNPTVYNVAFAPDGKTLAVACSRRLVLWDVTGEPKVKAVTPGYFRGLAFGPDGQSLATSSSHCALRVYDVTGDALRERIPLAGGHTGPVTSLVLGGDRLVTGGRDAMVRDWDVSGGQPRQHGVIPFVEEFGTNLTLPAGGRSRAVVSSGPVGGVYDLSGGKAVLRGEAFGRIHTMLSADGDTLVLHGGVNMRVRDVRQDKAPERILKHPELVGPWALSADGKVVACSQKNKVYVWDLTQAKPTARNIVFQGGEVRVLGLSADGKTLAVAGLNPGLFLWDLRESTPRPLLTLPGAGWQLVSFAPDGLALAAYDAETVHVWNATTWRLRHEWKFPGHAVESLAFLGDSRYLGLGNRNGTAYVMRVSVGSAGASPSRTTLAGEGEAPAEPARRRPSPLDQLDATKIPAQERFEQWQPKELVAVGGTHARRQFRHVWNVAWRPDGKRIASGGDDGLVHLWDAANMERRAIITCIPHSGGWVPAFSPDGKTLACASVSRGNGVQLYNVAGAQPVKLGELPAFPGGIGKMVYSPNEKERLLVCQHRDGVIRLWDLAQEKPKPRATLEGHKGNNTALAISADGKTLASAGEGEKSIRLWDLSATGPKERPGISGITSAAYALSLSGDGKTLAVAVDNAPLRLWDLSAAEPKERPLAEPKESGSRSFCVTFAPDGRTVAVGVRERIDLWDVSGGKRKEILNGHTRVVHGLAFSPDGTTLVSASEDSTVRQWDLTGDKAKERFALTGHHSWVESLAFTPGDRELLSASRDGTVRSWAVANGTLQELSNRTLPGTQGSSLALSAHEPRRAVANSGHSTQPRTLWDLSGTAPKLLRTIGQNYLAVLSADGNLLAYYKTLPDGKRNVELLDTRDAKANPAILAQLDGYGGSLVFSPNGRWLASGYWSKDQPVLYLWDLSVKSTPRRHAFRCGEVRALAFSPNSRTLVAATMPQELHLWDVSGAQPGDLGSVPTGLYPTVLAFSPDGNTLACATHRLPHSEVLLHDTTDAWRVTRRWPTASVVHGLGFSNDNRYLALGNGNGTIYVLRTVPPLEPVTPIVVKAPEAPLVAPPLEKLDATKLPKSEIFDWQPKELVGLGGTHRQRQFGPARSVAWSPDGKRLATGGDDAMIHLWDAATMDRLALIPCYPRGGGWTPAFSPDGKLLACGCNSPSGGIHLYDVTGAQPKKVGELKEHLAAITRMVFSPKKSEQVIIAHYFDGTIRAWEVTGDKAKERWRIEGYKESYPGLAIAPDGHVLAAGAETSVRLWDLSSGQPKEREGIPGLSGPRYHLAFAPDGKTLAVAMDKQFLRWWDVSGVKPRERLVSAARDDVRTSQCVAFAPDGRTVAVGRLHHIDLYDVTGVEAKRKAIVKAGHTAPLWSVAFAPDGRTLASAGTDGTVRLWDLVEVKVRERFALTGHHNWVDSLAFTPGDRELLSAARDGTVRSWTVKDGLLQEASRQVLPAMANATVRRSSVGQLRAVAYGGIVASRTLWDLHLPQPKARSTFPQNQVATLSQDGQLLAYLNTASASTVQVELLDLRQEKGKPLILGQLPTGAGFLAFSPDARLLACGSVVKGAPIALWDLSAKPTPRMVLLQHAGDSRALAFAPDSRTLVAAARPGDLRMWDVSVAQPGELGTVPTGGAPVSLAFSPDGNTLACGTEGFELLLHDRTTGWRVRHRWQKLPYRAITCAFAHDNRHLAVGNANGTIYVLRIPPPSEPPSIVVKVAEPPAVLPLEKLDATQILRDERFDAWQPRDLVAILGTHRQRHFAPVYTVAVSPDGKWVAAGGRNGTISVFDTATMRKRIVLGDPGRQDCYGLAFSPDSRTLVAAVGMRSVVWDLSDPEKPTSRLLPEAGTAISTVAFAPDGKTVITGSHDGTLRAWAVTPGEWKPRPFPVGHKDRVTALSFSKDGKRLATVGYSDTVAHVWDLSTAESKLLMSVAKPADLSSRGVALSPDGNTLAIGDVRTTMRLFDLRGTEAMEKPIPAKLYTTNTVYGLAFAPDGRSLAVGCYTGLALWDVSNGAKLTSWTPGNHAHVAFAADGKTLATGGVEDCTVRLWGVSSGTPKERFPVSEHHADWITGLAYDAANQRLISAARDERVRYWDVSGIAPRLHLTKLLTGAMRSPIALPARGQPLAVSWSTSSGGKAALWDLMGQTAKEKAAFTGPMLAEFAANGQVVAYRYPRTKTVQVWDVREPRAKERTLPHAEAVNVLALSADGTRLACGELEKVRLWDLSGPTPRAQVVDAKAGQVQALAFSPDAKTLVVGGSGPDMHVWDLQSAIPTEVARIPGALRSVVFAPDGKAFAGYNGSEVVVWDAFTWRRLWQWSSPDLTHRLAFVGDSRHLALGNCNGTIYVVRVPGGSAGASPSLAALLREGEAPAEPRRPVAGPLDQLDATKIPQDERPVGLPTDVVAVAGSYQQRHVGPPNSVAWSGNGRWIATGGKLDSTVCLWDAATMRRLAELQPIPKAQNLWVAFSPDSKWLAVGANNHGAVFLINPLAPRDKPLVLQGFSAGVGGLAFSLQGDKTWLTGQYRDSMVRTWDLSGPQPKMLPALQGVKPSGTAPVFSAYGRTLAAFGPDETLRTWEVSGSELKEKATIPGLTGAGKFLALAPDGKTVALAQGASFRLWDLSSGKATPRKIAPPPPGARVAYSVAFSLDGKTLAVGMLHQIELWDVSGEVKWKGKLTGHKAYVTCLAFSPDGQQLVSGSYDQTVRQWDLSTLKERFALTGHDSNVSFLAFTPDDSELVSAANDGTMRTWRLDAGQLRQHSSKILKGMEGAAIRLTTSGPPRAIATGYAYTPRGLWDVSSAEPRELKHFPGNNTTALAADGRMVAAVLKVGTKVQIELHDLRDPKAKPILLDVPPDVLAMAFSPDGRWLAAGNATKGDPVCLWDLTAKPKPRLSSIRYPGELRALAFTPDSRTLVAAGLVSSLHLWDVSGGQPGELATVPTGYYPNTLAFSADGKVLAVSTNNGEVLLHDVADSWRVTRRWQFPGIGTRSLAFAHDNRHLAVGNMNGTIHVLRLSATETPAVPIVVKPAEPGPAPGPLDNLDAAQIPAEERFPTLQPPELVAVLGTHRHRHFGTINNLVISPDGKHLACGPSVMLSVFDTATYRRRAAKLDVEALDLAFSKDSATIATAHTGAVEFWSVSGPDLKRTVRRTHPHTVVSLDYAGANTLVTGSRDGVVRCWDVAAWKETRAIPAFPALPGGDLRTIAISEDGKVLAALGMPGPTIRMWDLSAEAPKELPSISLREDAPAAYRRMVLSPDGKTLALADPTNTVLVRLWDLRGAEPKELAIPKPKDGIGAAWGLAFSRDGKSVAVGAHHGFATCDLSEGGKLTVRTNVDARCVAFAPGGRTLYTGGSDGMVRTWDLSAAEPKLRMASDTAARGPIWSLATGPGEASLAFAGSDGRVRSWDLSAAAPREMDVIDLPRTARQAILLPPRGQPWAVTDRLWNLTGRKAVAQGTITGQVFSADGNTLVHYSGKTVRLWNLRDPKAKPRVFTAPEEVTAAALSPTEPVIAWAEKDVVRLLSVTDPSKGHRLTARVGTVQCLAFSPDGKTLVASGLDRRLQVWEVGEGKAKEVWDVPGAHWLTGLSFSPDGRYVVGAGHQEGVFVWDTTSGRMVYEWRTVGVVATAAFVGDGRHVAVGNRNGTVYVLRLPTAW